MIGYDRAMKQPYYTKIPDFFCGLPISPAAFRVAVTLASYSKSRGECTCAVGTIAACCRMSVSTARRALHELEQQGLIQSFPRYEYSGPHPRQTSNGYRLCWELGPETGKTISCV